MWQTRFKGENHKKSNYEVCKNKRNENVGMNKGYKQIRDTNR